LKSLESQVAVDSDPAQLNGYFDRLDEIEEGVNHTRIASNYSDYVYNLRIHIDLVRNRLHRLEGKTQNA